MSKLEPGSNVNKVDATTDTKNDLESAQFAASAPPYYTNQNTFPIPYVTDRPASAQQQMHPQAQFENTSPYIPGSGPAHNYATLNPTGNYPQTNSNYTRSPNYYAEPQAGLAQQQENTPKWTILGFCFSWIPIVGLITYCANWNAPRGSKRKKWANRALGVAVVVSLLNLFLFKK